MITESEVPQAAEKLKNNISLFSDKIRSEMMASLDTLMPVYEKLFNSILNLGTMPQTWCGGLITPIYSLRGRRSKLGKGKGIRGKTTREGGGRRETPAGKPLFSPFRLLIKKWQK